MTKKAILEVYNEYIVYCENVRGCNDTEHWNGLKEYIKENHKSIKDVTWYDLAGGFTSFVIDEGNTLSIGNELFDGNNNVIEYAIGLKSYQALENDDFDMELIPQTYSRIWGSKSCI